MHRNNRACSNERMLPNLHNNIKCGNALIGTEYFASQTSPDLAEMARVNAFDWSVEFSDIFKKGGFDAVIGNPPWGADFTSEDLSYLRRRYQDVVARTVDSYIYFIAHADQITKKGKPIGFIVPSGILNQVDTHPVRTLLIKRGLAQILSLGEKIFGPKVLNTSTIFISENVINDKNIIVSDLTTTPLGQRPSALKDVKGISRAEWLSLVTSDPHETFFTGQLGAAKILESLREKHGSFGSILKNGIQRGVSPDIAAAHVINHEAAKALKLEEGLLKKSVSGTQVKRYQNWAPDQVIIYTTKDTELRNFPNIKDFLNQHKSQNTCPEVEQGKHPYSALHRPRDPEIFRSPKFIGLTTSKTIELIFDEKDSLYVTDAMYVFSLEDKMDPYAVMAILQSKTFLFLYRIANQGDSRVIPQIKASKLETLPFPSKVSAAEAQGLREWVEKIISLNMGRKNSESQQVQTVMTRQVHAVNTQIDQLVYKLYGLTEEEIRIVEEATK